jgi:hypothetical protein
MSTKEAGLKKILEIAREHDLTLADIEECFNQVASKREAGFTILLDRIFASFRWNFFCGSVCFYSPELGHDEPSCTNHHNVRNRDIMFCFSTACI